MEMKYLTTAELIKATKNELVKTGFTNLTLKGIERVWNNLEEYLHGKGINYFSFDLGIAFLKERYQFTETPSLSSADQRRLRAIQLLADFQTHQRILIRRKQRRYEFAQPFEKVFVEFMDFRKKAGISSKTLESYIIYLERFSQYLFNHEINHVAECVFRSKVTTHSVLLLPLIPLHCDHLFRNIVTTYSAGLLPL